jgi:hypothetical protein
MEAKEYAGDYLSILPHSVAIPWLKSEEIRLLKTDMQQNLAPLGFLWSPEHAGTATHAFVKELRKTPQRFNFSVFSSVSFQNRTAFGTTSIFLKSSN